MINLSRDLSINCTHCGAANPTKAGHIRGHQRYKSTACERHFTDAPKRAKSAATKAFAISMHTLCNASLGMIGKAAGVSNVAVLKWTRSAALTLDRPQISSESAVIFVDEMWHFVGSKKTNIGSGKPMTLCQSLLSDGNWGGVMMEH